MSIVLQIPAIVKIFAPILLVFLSACSNNGQFPGQTPIIVDTKGVDMSRYESDLSDCEAYSQQVNVGGKAAVHGATGAVVAGTVGAIFDAAKVLVRVPASEQFWARLREPHED